MSDTSLFPMPAPSKTFSGSEGLIRLLLRHASAATGGMIDGVAAIQCKRGHGTQFFTASAGAGDDDSGVQCVE